MKALEDVKQRGRATGCGTQCVALMDFRVAPQAEAGLDEIWYFLTTQSSNIDVADRVIDSIAARVALLARTRTSAVAVTRTCDERCAVSWWVTT